MPQSLSKIYLHLVFSTKNRRPFLQNKDLRDRTHAYLAGICRNLESPSIRVGGVEDHVHVLCYLSRTEQDVGRTLPLLFASQPPLDFS